MRSKISSKTHFCTLCVILRSRVLLRYYCLNTIHCLNTVAASLCQERGSEKRKSFFFSNGQRWRCSGFVCRSYAAQKTLNAKTTPEQPACSRGEASNIAPTTLSNKLQSTGCGQGTEHRRYKGACTTTKANADSPSIMRSMAGRAISSNQEWHRVALGTKLVVLYYQSQQAGVCWHSYE